MNNEINELDANSADNTGHYESDTEQTTDIVLNLLVKLGGGFLVKIIMKALGY